MTEEMHDMIEVTTTRLIVFAHYKDEDHERQFLMIQLTNKGQLISQPFYPAALGTGLAQMIPVGISKPGEVVAASAFRQDELNIALGLMVRTEGIRIGLSHDGQLLIEADQPMFPTLGAAETIGRSQLSIRIPPAVGLVFHKDFSRN